MNDLCFSPADIQEFTWDKYQRKVSVLNRPVVIAWGLTKACDLKCIHCGVEAGKPVRDELSTEDALKAIDNMAEAGTKHLLLAGGEPLLREDIFTLAEYASKRVSVGINTNGFSLNRSTAKRLRDCGVNQMRISLDGAKPKTHDRIRGNGSFEKAVSAIETCITLGFPDVGIEATIFSLNYDELPDMVKLSCDLGVGVFEAGDLAPVGRAKKLAHLCLSKEQRKEMLRFLAEIQETLPTLIITSELPHIFIVNKNMQNTCIDPYSKDVSLGCGAGIVGAGLTVDGKIVPCPLGLQVEIGDIKRDRLKDIWVNSPFLKRLQSREVTGKCGRCEYQYACGGCRGAAAMAGDFMGEDPGCWYEPALEY
ncbi:MAG: radical SAM protein [Thermodesulfobacteriota bacterium]|nr:radical SAM protein [Thermodesulfobacteriota bacterium]